MNARTAMVDRYQGVMLAGALGDALGAPFEGAAQVKSRHIEQVLDGTDPLRYTDDTHMTIGLADMLIEAGHLDGALLASTWATNYRAEPWRGYGPGPGQVFALHEQRIAWDAAAHHLYGGRGSWGNGAAMRVAPVALLAFDDLEVVAQLARQTAVITHTHHLGVEGAVAQAVAIALLLQQAPQGELHVERFLETLRAHVGAAQYCHQIDGLPGLLSGEPWAREAVVRVLGNGVAAHESVVTALYCFLRHRTDIVACLRFAISLGGDTDTIAAMAGTLAGAHLGMSQIPGTLIGRLEAANRLRDQADALLGLARSRMPMRPEALS